MINYDIEEACKLRHRQMRKSLLIARGLSVAIILFEIIRNIL